MDYDKKYLTVRETAEYLGSTQQGVYKMAFDKKIRYYKPSGKKLYFALADIEDYITGGEVIEPISKEQQL